MISPVKTWRRQKNTRRIIGSTGTVVSWTKIFVAGADFKTFAPYFVVLVRLKNGQQVFGQLVDANQSDVTIGKKVIATLRKVREPTTEGIIAYGVKFKVMV